MKVKVVLLSFLSILLTASIAFAQPVPNPTKTESSDPNADRPLDGIVEKTTIKDKRILPYDNIREADVFWEKRIWRIIDVREKMNKSFAYPERMFVEILFDAAENGEITVYDGADDKFSTPLDASEAKQKRARLDTTVIYDPVTFQEEYKVVPIETDLSMVKRFRIKEVWFFDEETSTMQVRILGIAPLLEDYDNAGNFRFEIPLFWVYYPDARKVLAREEAFNPLNDAVQMSWEDIFEMRYFSSYIYKESNVYDRRIQDYKTGLDILVEADRIKSEIFNFEHDLWSY